MTENSAAEAGEAALRDRAVVWRAWLFNDALPLWAEHGINPCGGFFDRLTLEGGPVAEPMRLRVQARQTYVFAEAGRLGWTGDWRSMAAHGLEFLLTRAIQPDGLAAQRFELDGVVIEARPDLYDQSFVLFALAAAFRALGDERARAAAYAMFDTLQPHRHPLGGFRELAPGAGVLKANPQMHLLEAALAWADLDENRDWRGLADDLVQLCVEHLVDPGRTALREFFVGDWRPAPEPLGDHTEPGHHFEWAWLLHRAGDAHPAIGRALCERAETQGVDPVRTVAVNAIAVNGEVLDADARLWPQTERLKAALLMRHADPRWTAHACQAADSLALYTRPVRPGLWLDVMQGDGSLRLEPAPASSFYHLVCAISELLEAVRPSP